VVAEMKRGYSAVTPTTCEHLLVSLWTHVEGRLSLRSQVVLLLWGRFHGRVELLHVVRVVGTDPDSVVDC